jgi:hypothetical protein
MLQHEIDAEEHDLLLEKTSVEKSGNKLSKVLVALALSAAAIGAVSWGTQRNNNVVVDDVDTTKFVKIQSETSSLSMSVKNQYGQLPQHTKKVYGFFDAVVEPHTSTTFEVLNADPQYGYNWQLSSKSEDGEKTVLHENEGPEMVYEFGADTNKWFTLTLTESLNGEVTQTLSSEKIVSKFVRREIRSLTDKDRNKILDAMEIMYRLDEAEGKEKYGNKYMSIGYISGVHSATHEYCFHWGDMFITSHPAFQLWFEQSLRAVDPTISSTFYWDFMYDSVTLGKDWPTKLDLFQDDWFGPMGTEENMWQVTEGRFKNVVAPRHKPDYLFQDAKYNSYGVIGQPCDNSKSLILQRSADFCGLRTEMTFSNAVTMIHCFEDNVKLRSWDLCLEINIHGEMHSLHGGAYDCYNDFAELVASDPVKYPRKVMDFIGVGAFNFWFKEMNDQLATSGCVKQQEDASWPCNLDDDTCAEVTNVVDFTDHVAVDDSKMYKEYANIVYEFMQGTQEGSGYLERISERDTELTKLGALYKWKHLPPSEQVEFTRFLMIFGSNPGKTAISSSGAAPAEPLFWAWHSMFDKMFHILRLSPRYNKKYDFTWVPTAGDDSDCGAHWLDHFPFTDIFENMPKGVKYTNKQLWKLLDPTEGHLPYIYEQFTYWGDKEWDPMDEDASYEDILAEYAAAHPNEPTY